MSRTADLCHLLIFKWIIISIRNCLERKIIFFCIWNDSHHVFSILSGTFYLYNICMLVCMVICVFKPVYIIPNYLRRHIKAFQIRTKLLKISLFSNIPKFINVIFWLFLISDHTWSGAILKPLHKDVNKQYLLGKIKKIIKAIYSFEKRRAKLSASPVTCRFHNLISDL